MILLDNLPPIKGYLDIIVANHYTGEILRHDHDHNQIQDWARHALTYLLAGRLFSTWGNHGEQVTDVGNPFTIPHYKDGKDGSESTDIIQSSPWTYSSSLEGLIQLRTRDDGDQIGGTTLQGTPLYPFFPTKMRFGLGGLDANQNPRTSGLIAANNMVTFSCKLPGGSAGYPYNGKVISEAGLFCDAALIPSGSTDTNMRTGTMLAYRSFYGITKDESIDIIFNWTFKS